MPAQTEVKPKYERVEQDKNVPHAGMRVFAYIDLQTEFLVSACIRAFVSRYIIG
jgi:hypothetical protein